jgi:hypothetical protein
LTSLFKSVHNPKSMPTSKDANPGLAAPLLWVLESGCMVAHIPYHECIISLLNLLFLMNTCTPYEATIPIILKKYNQLVKLVVKVLEIVLWTIAWRSTPHMLPSVIPKKIYGEPWFQSSCIKPLVKPFLSEWMTLVVFAGLFTKPHKHILTTQHELFVLDTCNLPNKTQITILFRLSIKEYMQRQRYG